MYVVQFSVNIVVYLSRAILTTLLAPGKNSALWVHSYTTTHSNKTVNVDNIKQILIVLLLSSKSVLKHYKTCSTQHTYINMGPRATAHRAHMLRRHCFRGGSRYFYKGRGVFFHRKKIGLQNSLF